MYALFKETSHANFISHKSNYGVNPAANPKNWVAFDGQHVHYSTNNLDVLTQELVWYFRKTAGELNESIFNDRATITAIKGNSVIWNQIVTDPNFTKHQWNNNGNSAVSYGVNGVTITSNVSSNRFNINTFKTIKDHKYYLIAYLTSQSTGIICFETSRGWLHVDCNISNNNLVNKKLKVSGILNTTADIDQYDWLQIWINKSNATYTIHSVNVIDLTMIYGEGNEPTTTDQFEADYFKWFGHPICYEPYDKGSIRHTKIHTLKTIGFNQWDEECESGCLVYNSDDINFGDNVSSNQIRSKNFIKVIPNTNYYLRKNPNIVGTAFAIFYDDNKKGIATVGYKIFNQIITVPQNASYMRIYFTANYGTFYQNDFCINISNSNLNGTYEPYEDRTYSIPITSITGKLNGSGNSVVVFPDGMKSVGSVCDEIIVEGGVTKAIKRIGCDDLGTYSSWSYTGSPGAKFYIIKDYMKGAPGAGIANMLCTKYKIDSDANSNNNNYDQTISLTTYGFLSIHDWNYDIGSMTAFKNQLSGVFINYELTTPQVYVLDNFSLPLNIKVWKSGTERYESNDLTGTSPKLTIHYNAQ